MQFKRSRKSSLHTLTETIVRNPFAGIRESYARTQAASCFVEWIEIATEPEHPAPDLFRLLQRAFGFLAAHEPSLRALRHFEAELARLSGVRSATRSGDDAAATLASLFGRVPRGRGLLLKALG